MSNAEENVEFPAEHLTYYYSVICDVLKNEDVHDYTTVVTPASGKGENYIGLLYRIKVTVVNEHGEEAKRSLVLKIPPQSLLLREKIPVNTLYAREAYIYNVVLPEMCALQDRFNVPESEKFTHVKCYRADATEKFNEYLLFEDMCDRGFEMSNRRQSLEFGQLKLVLRRLASYHALSFVLKKLKPETFIEFTKHAGSIADFNSAFRHFLELCRIRAIETLDDEVVAERVEKFSADIMGRLEYYLNPESVDQYTVLCHGDCWNNNILFKYQDEEPVDVMLLDWQIARNCSPITDIAYLMFSSTDYDLRKEHFETLMAYYHECLAKSLSYMECDVEDHYPKAIFEEHLKKVLTYGLFMSFMLLPAVLGEAEDVPDMDSLLLKDKLDQSDLKFENKQSSNRYESRMKGVVKTFMEMNLI